MSGPAVLPTDRPGTRWRTLRADGRVLTARLGWTRSRARGPRRRRRCCVRRRSASGADQLLSRAEPPAGPQIKRDGALPSQPGTAPRASLPGFCSEVTTARPGQRQRPGRSRAPGSQRAGSGTDAGLLVGLAVADLDDRPWSRGILVAERGRPSAPDLEVSTATTPGRLR